MNLLPYFIPLLVLLQEGSQPPPGGDGTSGPPTIPVQPAGQGQNQTPPVTPAPQGGDIWTMLIPMILIFVVFYFLLIRPQKRQAQEREQMIANLRRRDVVITSGGIKGRIEKIRDNEMTLVIDEKKDVRIRVLKSAVVALDQKGDAEDEEVSKDGESDSDETKKSSEEKK